MQMSSANLLTFWLPGKCIYNVTVFTPNVNLSILIRTIYTKESKMSGYATSQLTLNISIYLF